MDTKLLTEYLNKGIDIKTQQDSLKDAMKMLTDDVKENLDMPTSEFNTRLNAAYDKLKTLEKRDKLNEAIEDVAALGF